jgi:hypothetical protein
VGVDGADVAVRDEGDELFSRVLAAQTDVVEPAVVADGQDAGGVGAIASGPVVDRDRGFRWVRCRSGIPRLLGGAAADGAVGPDGGVVAAEPVELALAGRLPAPLGRFLGCGVTNPRRVSTRQIVEVAGSRATPWVWR